MAKIIGNIKPEDDYTHPLGPEPNFNESVYFNFFDRTQNRGGFVRIGNRANEGYAEMTVIVWNPDGSALFNYAKPDIADNDGWNAGGLAIDILEPAERVRTRYEGKARMMANPKDMQDPSAAFKNNPRTSLLIDLEHQAVGPMYGHVGVSQGTAMSLLERTRSSTCAFKGSCNWEMRRPSLSKVGGYGTTVGARDSGRQHLLIAGSLATSVTIWA